MFQILYFNGGVRKTKDIPQFKTACEEAVLLDKEGYFVSTISKLNRDGIPVKSVWELRDGENTKDAFKRLSDLVLSAND